MLKKYRRRKTWAEKKAHPEMGQIFHGKKNN